MLYRNLDLTLGIPASFNFVLKDATGLPLTLTGTSLRFEVFSNIELCTLIKTGTATNVIALTGSEASVLKEGRYSYRLFFLSSDVTPIPSEIYRGSLTVDGPAYPATIPT